jgi:ABC-type phosphate/phosphonate transport system substrate-binding protein
MYDWPEIRSDTQAYLSLLSESLAERGLQKPSILNCDAEPWDVWRNPMLLLGQTCGLPLIARLVRQVSVVGTPAYDIEGAAGSYYSVFVVHAAAEVASLEQFKLRRYAYNGLISQSGLAAFHSTFMNAGRRPDDWDEALCSGSHRESICAVASGRADIAAIDAVSFEIAKRYLPETNEVRVIARSEPTPGLPYVTGKEWASRQALIADSVDEAIAALPSATRKALLLSGLTRTRIEDYQVIAERWQKVQDKLPSGLREAIEELAN